MPPKQFKPPRPSTTGIKKANSKSKASTAKSNSTSKSKAKSKSKSTARTSTNTRTTLPSLSPDSPTSFANDPFKSPASSISISDTEPAPPSPPPPLQEELRTNIPPDLLTRLLHEFFKEETRVTKDAGRAVGMYIETFVREAVARAAFERVSGDGNGNVIGAGNGVDGGFLEVEDLEKLAPQLLLDF